VFSFFLDNIFEMGSFREWWIFEVWPFLILNKLFLIVVTTHNQSWASCHDSHTYLHADLPT
jgi:hypothetical protein